MASVEFDADAVAGDGPLVTLAGDGDGGGAPLLALQRISGAGQ